MQVTIVSGVAGVGASRVCQEARGRLDDQFELINFGDAMLERALARNGIDSRDDMAALPQPELRLLQRRAGEYVAERAIEKDIILNTHLAVATTHGFIAGLPATVQSDISPTEIVLVEADPGTIASRRDTVETREYREESQRSIELHQDLNRAAAMKCSTETGAPIQLIENTGNVDDAVTDLIAILTK